MPAMKRSPRSRVKARSSRISAVASPGWTDGSKAVFLTPKSPSPVAKKTRRSSVNKAGLMKPPRSQLISPPGVKTRARRTSIYQKGGGRLISPKGVSSRTRRASMYVSTNKPPMPVVNEFSKVWATPIKPVPVIVNSPELKNASDVNTKAAPVSSTNAKLKNNNALSSPVAMKRKPGRPPKTPRLSDPPKSGRKSVKRKASSPLLKSAASPEFKTPATKRRKQMKMPQSAESPKSSKKSVKKISPVPKYVASPATPVSKRSKTTKTPPMPKLVLSPDFTTPVTKSSATKSPKSARAPKSARKSTKKNVSTPKVSAEFKTPRTSSGKKMAKTPKRKLSSTKKSPKKAVISPKKKSFTTSTPRKTVEQITGKSFYSTPNGTPAGSKAVFKFSATPPSTHGQKGKRKSVKLTPGVAFGQKQDKKTYRKTPAIKRVEAKVEKIRRESLKGHSTPKQKVVQSSQRSAVKSSQPMMSKKVQLSPMEMSSVLRDVTEAEKKISEGSTPRAGKGSKKRLAGVMVGDEQLSNSDGSSVSMDDTFSSDSRSSRCIIL